MVSQWCPCWCSFILKVDAIASVVKVKANTSIAIPYLSVLERVLECSLSANPRALPIAILESWLWHGIMESTALVHWYFVLQIHSAMECTGIAMQYIHVPVLEYTRVRYRSILQYCNSTQQQLYRYVPSFWDETHHYFDRYPDIECYCNINKINGTKAPLTATDSIVEWINH